jgi:hypothetical protein
MEVAQSFTAGAAVDFASATLSLGTGVGGGTFSVQLWSDVSGSPGSSLVTLVGNPNPVSAGLYTYTATTPFALSASATYWVVAMVSHTAPDKIYSWNATASTTETGDAGWSLGDKAMSRFVLGGSPDAWGSESFAAQMGITVVPETATLWPLVVFLGFGLGLRFAAKRMSFGRANEQTTAVSRRWNPIRVVG